MGGKDRVLGGQNNANLATFVIQQLGGSTTRSGGVGWEGARLDGMGGEMWSLIKEQVSVTHRVGL